MHTDRVCDLHHRHRFEEGGPVIQKVALPFYDLDRNIQDGLLPLMDAFDQKLTTPDFFSNVVSDFTAVPALRHQISISLVNPEMRYLIAGERHDIVITDFFDHNIRQHVAIGFRGKDLPRFRIKGGDEIGGLLNLVDGQAQPSGNVRIPFAAEVIKVLVDNLVLNALAFAESPQLDEQAIF